MSNGKPNRAAVTPARSETAVLIQPVEQAAAILPQSGPAPGTDSGPAIAPDPVAAAVAETVAAVSEAPAGVAAPEAVQAQAETAADGWAAIAETQAVLGRALADAAEELTGFGRSGLDATADAAVALLGARSFAEAIEINARLARRSFDALVACSTKLSEIAVKASSQAAAPALSQFAASRAVVE